MPAPAPVTEAIEVWAPRRHRPEVVAFARRVVTAAEPKSAARAKALLFAAGKLADFATSLGLALDEEVLLRASLIERFVSSRFAGTPPTARTLRANLRYLAAHARRDVAPGPIALPRQRAKAPYASAELAAYLALADAQPTPLRRERAGALICLGAGAGLIGAELRFVRGTDVVCRSGGVLVVVGGRRPRAVPVLAPYHERLLGAAAFFGARYLVSGTNPQSHNVTNPLLRSLSGGIDLPRLETPRLRSSYLVAMAGSIGLGAFMAAAGVTCTQRLGDLVAHLDPPDEAVAVALLGRGASVKTLARIEALLDEPGLAATIGVLEAALPIGVRPRQLRVRTLFVGMLGCLAEGHQNAHLSSVHAVLVGLEEADQERLSVRALWKGGAHALTYRQVEYTLHVLERALSKDTPDGAPSARLQAFCDQLLEASIPVVYKDATGAYAIDWTDVESFSRPPSEADGPCADPEAYFGHRRGDGPGQKDEMFFGYYDSLMVMVPERAARRVPELIRRAQLVSCRIDPVPGFVGVVTSSAANGVVVAEVLADCGYSYKVPEHFAFPLRAAGVHLVVDLHPNDRGPKGTFAGAIAANGNLYCPKTPPALFSLGPLARGASAEETAAHDARAAELARYKLGRISSQDTDGYHRVGCPALTGKLRCPLRASSMALPNSRPEVFAVPEHPPTCCTNQTITVPPEVNAKTRQRHDYPSAAHRASYGRRSGAERANSRLKDPAGINIDQLGWCKLMGLVPLSLFLACACVVVNFHLIDAFEAHQADQARRAATPVPRPRARRRKTLADLARAPAPP